MLADEDERRCDTCGKLHGKRFSIDANIPIPAHPCCRCCIVPVVEEKDIKEQGQSNNELYKLHSRSHLTNEKSNSNIKTHNTTNTTVESMTSVDWSQADFFNEEHRERHKKHLKEYGDITFEEYVQGARELLSKPLDDNIDGFCDKDGALY